MQNWSIIVFFYNEEGNVERVCRQVIDFLKPLPDDKKEVIFVNDGSTDSSVECIERVMRGQNYIKFINHKTNLGIGTALKTGYKIAEMENICAIPGDGQFDLNELKAFRNIPSKTIVSFFRVSHPGYSFSRLILTKVNKWINRIFFSFYLKDVNWIKIYKKDSLKNLPLRSKSQFIESEIFYFLIKTHKVVESPCHFLPRQSGASKAVNFVILVKVFIDVVYLFFFRFSLT